MKRNSDGMPYPSIPSDGATAAVNGRDKTFEMERIQDESRRVEFLLIDNGQVLRSDADLGVAIAACEGRGSPTAQVFRGRCIYRTEAHDDSGCRVPANVFGQAGDLDC